MICYRRRGHNEADNPSFTQPLMYDLIDAKRSTRKLYTEALIGRGDITLEEAEQALRDYQQELERAFTETKDAISRPAEPGALRRPAPARGVPGRLRGRADRDHGRDDQADHRHPGHAARRLHRAPAAAAAAAAPGRDGGAGRDRLGAPASCWPSARS